ncbi:MAG: integrase [Legionellaceae bacterium]|nr:integrase [Legionellaceae bacterium]
MRKYSLRQTANRYLKMDHRGSFKDKQHRAFVIHKMIDDLFVIGHVPTSWQTLEKHHLEQLVQHWQKRRINPATIMRYMTTIRKYLVDIGCLIAEIDNQSLQLARSKTNKKQIDIQPDIWKRMHLPIPRLIMALQTQFGLNFSEAIHLLPDIHIKEHGLWITREIAFNSEDRMIPIRNTVQKTIVAELCKLTNNQSMRETSSYDNIRTAWRNELTNHHLPTNKSWRYLYARQLYQTLCSVLGNYQACWVIRDEMGIKSRNTLWLYLNE